MNKKFLLSSFLILLFAAYVIVQHDNVALQFYNARKNPASGPVFSTSVPASSSDNSSPVSPQPPSAVLKQKYKDGQYAGSVQNALYGNVQVEATIQGGAITAVDLLQYPNTRGTSVYINSQALPILKSEAIQAQSANVDIVSGATFTSEAYRASLADALSQATG